MRIGIDFDNTVVSYDELFYRIALERSLVPPDIAPTKLNVREHLRRAGREDIWTEMQGYVYGARMQDAQVYPGVIAFLSGARAAGVSLAIVSHKTRQPFLGHPYDLHAAARGWVEEFLMKNANPLIAADDVYFELTKDAKLARIDELRLDYFVDDLPEILLAEGFPDRTGRILFDPYSTHARNACLASFSDWGQIGKYLQNEWKTRS